QPAEQVLLPQPVQEFMRGISGAEDLALAISPDGRRLATGDVNGTIRLWDPLSGEHLRYTSNSDRRITSLAYSPNGRQLASACMFLGGAGGGVRLWDVATGQPIRAISVPGGGGAAGVAFSPDGRLLAVTSWSSPRADNKRGPSGGRLWFFAAATGEVVGSTPVL